MRKWQQSLQSYSNLNIKWDHRQYHQIRSELLHQLCIWRFRNNLQTSLCLHFYNTKYWKMYRDSMQINRGSQIYHHPVVKRSENGSTCHWKYVILFSSCSYLVVYSPATSMAIMLSIHWLRLTFNRKMFESFHCFLAVHCVSSFQFLFSVQSKLIHMFGKSETNVRLSFLLSRHNIQTRFIGNFRNVSRLIDTPSNAIQGFVVDLSCPGSFTIFQQVNAEMRKAWIR